LPDLGTNDAQVGQVLLRHFASRFIARALRSAPRNMGSAAGI
jgi:hypothetical protein